jgi:hypothetical protein
MTYFNIPTFPPIKKYIETKTTMGNIVIAKL